jgi:hypothetical protein
MAHLMGAPRLAVFARSTAASPLPLAFSQPGSLAGFAKELTIELTGPDGNVERRTESSELFAGLPGPYERRIIYGTALTFGPLSPRPLLTAILRFGFCDAGPLAERMGVSYAVHSVALVAESRSTGVPRRIEIACSAHAAAR